MEITIWNDGKYKGEWQSEQTTVWMLFFGRGEVIMEGVSHTVHEGDVILQPPKRKLYYDLHCSGVVGRIQINQPAPDNRVPILSGACTEQLGKTFFYIMEMGVLSRNDNPELLSQLVTPLEALFWGMLSYSRLKMNPSDSEINHVIEEMMNRFTDPDYDLQETIEQLHYSASYFRRIFRKTTGVSPNHFLVTLRLNYAKEYMRNTHGQISVQEAAEHAGFRDTNSFARYFKNFEGISPTEYMQQFRLVK